MWYALVNVYEHNDDGTVSGSWIQNAYGTLAEVKERARGAEVVNSNKIEVAVVADYPSGSQFKPYWHVEAL